MTKVYKLCFTEYSRLDQLNIRISEFNNKYKDNIYKDSIGNPGLPQLKSMWTKNDIQILFFISNISLKKIAIDFFQDIAIIDEQEIEIE